MVHTKSIHRFDVNYAEVKIIIMIIKSSSSFFSPCLLVSVWEIEEQCEKLASSTALIQLQKTQDITVK